MTSAWKNPRGREARQAAQVWVPVFSRPMAFVALGPHEMPEARGQAQPAPPSRVRERRWTTREAAAETGQGCRGQAVGGPGARNLGSLRCAASPRALGNSGHKGEEVSRLLPNRSSTSDSSVAGEGSPGLGPESPQGDQSGDDQPRRLSLMDHGRAKRSPWGVLLEVHLGREGEDEARG